VSNPLAICRLGQLDYAEATALQKRLVEARVADRIEDVLLLLEHPPTITHSFTGRGSEHLLAGAEQLAERGVAVHTTDRGGDITFHGPGQLVGYPIVRLVERDLHLYLRRLEEVLIRSVASFGISTDRIEGRTGTWLEDGSRKIAAIGVKATRWVTLHGFALNVRTDLSFFDLIVPCGIADAGVTSLEQQLGSETPGMEAVCSAVAEAFGQVFELRPSPPSQTLATLLP